MEEKDKGEVKEKRGVRDFRYYLVQILLLLAVVAVGLLVVNQVLEFNYKSAFLQTPCNLCKELNPAVANCFNPINLGGENSNIKIINFSLPTSP